MTTPFRALESAAAPREENALQKVAVAPENLVPDKVLQFVRPAPVLDRMVLPGECLEPLQPAFTELGFTASEGKIEQAVLQTAYVFTLLRRGEGARALLYVPDSILTLYTRENKLALDEVRDLFQGKYNPLFLFHEANPTSIYRNLFLGEWREKYQLRVKLIPLADFRDLAGQPLGEQVKYLKRELEAEVAEAAAGPAPARPAQRALTVPELLRLHQVFGRLPEFETARGRRVLVESAGLLEFVFDYEGPPKTVAADLVNRLAKEKLLRSVLEVVKQSKDLPADELAFVEQVLEAAALD